MLGAPNTAIKERLGHAVVDLIASRAGCYVTQPPTDYKSTDVNIAPMAAMLPMQIDAQIKGVTSLKEKGGQLEYLLKRRNYDHLRDCNVLIPRVLLVADIAQEADNWLVCEEDSIRFCKGVYWCDLHGMPNATQESNVPVMISPENRLSAEALVAILEKGYANAKSGKGGLS